MGDLPKEAYVPDLWKGKELAITPSGSTAYGIYDTDPVFVQDALKTADWCARRLGYPIMDVELRDKEFYICFEEAIMEYSSIVNTFNIRDNLLSLQGTDNSIQLTHKNINTGNLSNIIKISDSYGVYVSTGGNVGYKSASIEITSGTQVYNIKNIFSTIEPGKEIAIEHVFHHLMPASFRMFGAYGGGLNSSIAGADALGGGFSTENSGTAYTLLPVYDDVLRMMSVEYGDEVRRSAYTFKIEHDELRIFPKPKRNFKLWVKYYIKDDVNNPILDSTDTVSDISNANYDFMQYSKINSTGKQWIFKYTLALVKQLVGLVRSKYQAIESGNSTISLNGESLISEARTEMDDLKMFLKESLEQTSKKNQIANKREELENTKAILSNIPLKIKWG